jgi:hypothetical protein
MRIETDEGFVSLIAENDEEAKLLAPIADAINKGGAETGVGGENISVPACLSDNLENGVEHRIINGILQLQIGG